MKIEKQTVKPYLQVVDANHKAYETDYPYKIVSDRVECQLIEHPTLEQEV